MAEGFIRWYRESAAVPVFAEQTQLFAAQADTVEAAVVAAATGLPTPT
ncbi:hypothetical protein [Streptomyces chrestomyceticus]|uniref:Uncharacterized protein n=1 Tax=Streptomyces chrestomyceticus TaxID=68185 RepID=A0ABU7WTG5_9ACTN